MDDYLSQVAQYDAQGNVTGFIWQSWGMTGQDMADASIAAANRQNWMSYAEGAAANAAARVDWNAVDAARVARIAANVAANQGLLNSAARDAAAMSDHSYNRGSLPAHLEQQSVGAIILLGLDPKAFYDDRSGFSASLYYNTDSSQYTLAFRGTEGLSLADWKANSQSLGIVTTQYQQAMSLAERVDQATGGNFISTGHSLGGGLASAAAIVTGTHAITFNAAGLHPNTVFQHNGSDLSNAANLVTAYYVRGEILNTGQDLTPLSNAAGTRIQLAPGSSAGSLSLHNMDQVLLAVGPNFSPGPIMGPFAPGP